MMMMMNPIPLNKILVYHILFLQLRRLDEDEEDEPLLYDNGIVKNK